jgi:SAM-dependent methyltransferase
MTENSRSARPCPACKSKRAEFVGEKNGYDIVACIACSTLYAATLPAQHESQDYDAYYSESNLTVPDFIRKRSSEIVSEFSNHRQLNRLLDIGFGAGSILASGASAGWDVFGQEVSRPAVEHARSQGFQAFLGELEEAGYPDGYFDVITASEIVEHLPDPEKTLREIRRILRPGGVFWATTPFARSLSFKLLGINWTVLSPPEHLQLYSIRGIAVMLEHAGFSKVRFKTTGVNPAEIMNHFRTRSKNRGTDNPPTLDRVGAGYRLNEQLTGTRKGLWLKNAANGTLNFFKIGDTLKILASR